MRMGLAVDHTLVENTRAASASPAGVDHMDPVPQTDCMLVGAAADTVADSVPAAAAGRVLADRTALRMYTPALLGFG